MPLNLLQNLKTKKVTCKKCGKVISVPVGMDMIECDGSGTEHEVIFAEGD